MHIEWPAASNDIQIDIRSGQLTICGERPRIFWSNKYMPFNDFILVNRGFGEWTSKPTFGDRLLVSISPSDKEDQLSLLYLTKMRFEIIDAHKILVISTNI